MGTLPATHITDSMKLNLDGKVHLFELQPVTGGSIFLKPDNPVTWLGIEYESVPISISGEKKSADSSTPTPRAIIGQENIDLSVLKGPIHDGHLEGGLIIRHKVLLDNILANNNIKETDVFKIKRVENYSSSRISLLLATHTSAAYSTWPHRQYIPPAFPWVKI